MRSEFPTKRPYVSRFAATQPEDTERFFKKNLRGGSVSPEKPTKSTFPPKAQFLHKSPVKSTVHPHGRIPLPVQSVEVDNGGAPPRESQLTPKATELENQSQQRPVALPEDRDGGDGEPRLAAPEKHERVQTQRTYAGSGEPDRDTGGEARVGGPVVAVSAASLDSPAPPSLFGPGATDNGIQPLVRVSSKELPGEELLGAAAARVSQTSLTLSGSPSELARARAELDTLEGENLARRSDRAAVLSEADPPSGAPDYEHETEMEEEEEEEDRDPRGWHLRPDLARASSSTLAAADEDEDGEEEDRGRGGGAGVRYASQSSLASQTQTQTQEGNMDDVLEVDMLESLELKQQPSDPNLELDYDIDWTKVDHEAARGLIQDEKEDDARGLRDAEYADRTGEFAGGGTDTGEHWQWRQGHTGEEDEEEEEEEDDDGDLYEPPDEDAHLDQLLERSQQAVFDDYEAAAAAKAGESGEEQAVAKVEAAAAAESDEAKAPAPRRRQYETSYGPEELLESVEADSIRVYDSTARVVAADGGRVPCNTDQLDEPDSQRVPVEYSPPLKGQRTEEVQYEEASGAQIDDAGDEAGSLPQARQGPISGRELPAGSRLGKGGGQVTRPDRSDETGEFEVSEEVDFATAVDGEAVNADGLGDDQFDGGNDGFSLRGLAAKDTSERPPHAAYSDSVQPPRMEANAAAAEDTIPVYEARDALEHSASSAEDENAREEQEEKQEEDQEEDQEEEQEEEKEPRRSGVLAEAAAASAPAGGPAGPQVRRRPSTSIESPFRAESRRRQREAAVAEEEEEAAEMAAGELGLVEEHEEEEEVEEMEEIMPAKKVWPKHTSLFIAAQAPGAKKPETQSVPFARTAQRAAVSRIADRRVPAEPRRPLDARSGPAGKQKASSYSSQRAAAASRRRVFPLRTEQQQQAEVVAEEEQEEEEEEEAYGAISGSVGGGGAARTLARSASAPHTPSEGRRAGAGADGGFLLRGSPPNQQVRGDTNRKAPAAAPTRKPLRISVEAKQHGTTTGGGSGSGISSGRKHRPGHRAAVSPPSSGGATAASAREEVSHLESPHGLGSATTEGHREKMMEIIQNMIGAQRRMVRDATLERVDRMRDLSQIGSSLHSPVLTEAQRNLAAKKQKQTAAAAAAASAGEPLSAGKQLSRVASAGKMSSSSSVGSLSASGSRKRLSPARSAGKLVKSPGKPATPVSGTSGQKAISRWGSRKLLDKVNTIDLSAKEGLGNAYEQEEESLATSAITDQEPGLENSTTETSSAKSSARAEVPKRQGKTPLFLAAPSSGQAVPRQQPRKVFHVQSPKPVNKAQASTREFPALASVKDSTGGVEARSPSRFRRGDKKKPSAGIPASAPVAAAGSTSAKPPAELRVQYPAAGAISSSSSSSSRSRRADSGFSRALSGTSPVAGHSTAVTPVLSPTASSSLQKQPRPSVSPLDVSLTTSAKRRSKPAPETPELSIKRPLQLWQAAHASDADDDDHGSVRQTGGGGGMRMPTATGLSSSGTTVASASAAGLSPAAAAAAAAAPSDASLTITTAPAPRRARSRPHHRAQPSETTLNPATHLFAGRRCFA